MLFLLINALVLTSAFLLTALLNNFKFTSWIKLTLQTFTLAYALIFLTLILPGSAGILSFASVFILSVAITITLAIIAGRKALKTEFPPASKTKWALPVAIFAPFALLFTLRYFYAQFQPPLEYDSIAYHLPFVVEWYKSGSLMGIYYNAFAGPLGYYPSNFELFELWAVLPYGRDCFVNLINMPLFPLLGIATYAVAKNFKLTHQASLLAAAFLLYIPLFGHFLGFLHVDLFFTLTFVAAIYFIQEYWIKGQGMLFIALSIGAMLGTKFLGIPYAFPLVIAAIIAIIKHRKPLDLAALAGGATATGGFWYLRNWIEAGNPIFPTTVKIGETTIFDGYYGLTDRIFKLTLDYNIKDAAAFKDFVLSYMQNTGLQTYLIPIGAVVTALLATLLITRIPLKKAKPKDLIIPALLLAGLAYYFYFYWKAPYTFNNLIPNIRYSTPFMVFGALIYAYAGNKLLPLHAVLYGLIPLNIAYFVLNPQSADKIQGDRIAIDLKFISQNIEVFILYLAALTLIATTIYIIVSKPKITFQKRNLSTPVIVVMTILSIFATTQTLARTLYLQHHHSPQWWEKYFSDDPLKNLSIAKTGRHLYITHPEGARIAYTGFNFHYHLFGPNWQNEVDYININDCENCRYSDYAKSPDSIRRDPDYDAWRHNLRNKDYLITSPTSLPDIRSFEDEWIAEHPEDFTLVHEENEVYVYQINHKNEAD